VQVNADVNPGNSGGPLLDGRARVVGIVTLKAIGADGVGFALPLEYAREPAGLPPAAPEAGARWSAILARVAAEDDAEAERLRARLQRPVLLAAVPKGDRLAVVVMQHWGFRPSSSSVVVQVRDGGRVLCEASASASDWSEVESRLQELATQGRAERKVRWMLRRKLTAGVYAGVARMDMGACPSPAPASAVVSLRDDGDDAVEFPSRELAEARQAGGRARADDEKLRAEAEAAWRAAFREARERLDRLEERRRVLKRAQEAQDDVPLMEEARRSLPTVERDLARAREAFDDLDRQASRQAVPREWRSR
jgi:serine protease Do